MDSLLPAATQNVKETAFRVRLTGLEVSLGNRHRTAQGKVIPSSSSPVSLFHELPEVGNQCIQFSQASLKQGAVKHGYLSVPLFLLSACTA